MIRGEKPTAQSWLAGIAICVLFILIASIDSCVVQLPKAHADGEGSLPLPQTIIKVEYVPVPSPLVSTDRLVMDALAIASEAHNVSAGYLGCLVWKESRWKPWAIAPIDTNGRASLGMVMLNEAGLLQDFYRQGNDDPYDPYQAADYLALMVAKGPATVQHNWFHAFEACR